MLTYWKLYYILCLKDLERFTIYSVMFKTWKWKANLLCLKVQNIFFIAMWLNWTEYQCEPLPSFCNCHYLMNLQSLTSDISRSSFIHSSVCCLSVCHTVLLCHISLTLQCIAKFDMSWWRVTLCPSHITAGDMCTLDQSCMFCVCFNGVICHCSNFSAISWRPV